MTKQLPKLSAAAVLGALILAVTGGIIPAQQPGAQSGPSAPPADPNTPDGVEVLARGPVHEAFATTAEAPAIPPIVAKQPPEPIEELPPDQKPEGENVQWLPGYWHWDDDDSRFIWISGFWRSVPPGRIWVPGSWREVRGGWQWVPGFWQEPNPQQPQQPQIQYVPQPPQSVESGPSVAAPTATSIYAPGSWVWRGRFVWRPGFWIEHRPNWVWVPAHWRWTPVGFVFVDGYWDFPLANRGVLYAPVAFTQPVFVQPSFVFTPAYVVSEPCMVGALFVRRGWGCYYFGDYFAPRYTTVGFSAWCGTVGGGGGFAIGFGVGRTWGYDPLWSYYSCAYRNNPGWAVGVSGLYGGRFAGTVARPPVTLVQQNTVINNITNVNVRNVTNNVTVVNKNVRVNNTNVTDVAMLAPARAARDLQPEAKVQAISAQARKDEAQNAREVRQLAAQRKKLESEVKPVVKANDPPQTLKLDVSKNTVARSQVKDEAKAPPVNPNRDLKTATKVDPKAADHKPEPHPVFTNPRAAPKDGGKVDPKIGPKGPPKVDPKNPPKVDPKNPPKLDPKGKVDPKVDPKNLPPKLNPKGGDPKPLVITPQNPGGKVDPKGDPRPLKVEPKKYPPVISPPPVLRSQQPPVGHVNQGPPVRPRVNPPPLAARPALAQPVNPLVQLRSAANPNGNAEVGPRRSPNFGSAVRPAAPPPKNPPARDKKREQKKK